MPGWLRRFRLWFPWCLAFRVGVWLAGCGECESGPEYGAGVLYGVVTGGESRNRYGVAHPAGLFCPSLGLCLVVCPYHVGGEYAGGGVGVELVVVGVGVHGV